MLVWFLIRDEQVRKPFAAGFQTGLSFTNGRPSRPGRCSAPWRSSGSPEGDRERREHGVAQREERDRVPVEVGQVVEGELQFEAREHAGERQQDGLQRVARAPAAPRAAPARAGTAARAPVRRPRARQRGQQRQRAIGAGTPHAPGQQQRQADGEEREAAAQPARSRACHVLAAVVEGRAGVRPESPGDVGQHGRPGLDLGVAPRVVADPGEADLSAPEEIRDLDRDRHGCGRREQAQARSPARHRRRCRERNELERAGQSEPGARAARAARAAARDEDGETGRQVEARECEPAQDEHAQAVEPERQQEVSRGPAGAAARPAAARRRRPAPRRARSCAGGMPAPNRRRRPREGL